jgi:hypothetical protein
MYKVTRHINAVDSRYSGYDDLMRNIDTGKLEFRRIFATDGWESLDFETLELLVDFLNKNFNREHYLFLNDSGTYEVTYIDGIFLNYFGTVDEFEIFNGGDCE